MAWFLQHSNFQMGDFIMMTSGLRAVSELWGKKVKVYFESQVVKDLYRECPFIETLKTRPHKPYFATTMFSSWKHGAYRKKKISEEESMQECFFRLFAKNKGYDKSMPHTYVDNPMSKILTKEAGKKYIAVFHGCLGETFEKKKAIPMQSLKFLVDEIVRLGHIPVLLGSRGDFQKYWRNIKINKGAINYISALPIRDSVSILSQCDTFISNDTGLYHVASAYKMDGLVLWNATEFHKNAPSHSGVKRFQGKKLGPKDFNNAITEYLREV